MTSVSSGPVEAAEQQVREPVELERDEPTHGLWDIAGWVLAFVGASVLSLSFGFNHGVDNQTTYLLGALRLVSPGTLDADWYAGHTTHYHPVFTYLAAILLKLNGAGWGIAIADVVTTVVGSLFTYWAVLALCGRRSAPAVFLLLAGWMYLTRTVAPGSSYVFRGLFQPSSLGSLGLLATLPFYLRGRYLASGICLALGGLFHANFLLLSFPLFGAAHVLLGTTDLARRLGRQLGPACLSLLVLSPVIFAAIGSPDGAAARDIFLHMRSPHHFVPATFERAFSPFFGFQLLGLAMGAWSLVGAGGSERDQSNYGQRPSRRMGALLVSVLGLLWGGTVLTTATYIPTVAQLFVWRVAPFADLWCQLLVAQGVVLALADPAGMRRRFSNPTLALVCAGFGFLLMYYGDRGDRAMLGFLLALLAAFTVAWMLYFVGLLPSAARVTWRTTWGVGLATALAVGSYATIARDVTTRVRENSSMLRKLPAAELELYQWMHAHTPKEAQFLTPPDMEAARYQGQRPIVVDWKSSPIRPSEFLEWRNRIADVVGKAPEQFHGMRDLGGYHSMNQTRLVRLTRKYHLDYVVLRRGRERGLEGDVAFRNAGFVVLKVAGG